MFGYAAPVLPQKPGAPAPGAPPASVATPQSFPPPPPPAAPPQSFAPPPAAPPQSFAPPPQSFSPPPQQFAPPPQQFAPPPQQFAPPPQQFAPPPQQFAPPPQQFAPPPQQFAPPPQAAPPVAQPWAPPPSAPPLAAPPPTGEHSVAAVTAGSGFGLAEQASAQVRQGKLLGIPFSLLRDQQFEYKVLMVAAVALFVTRFFPLFKFSGFNESKWIFAWTEGISVFKMMVWPFLVAAVYAGVVFTPANVKQQIPAPVFRWAPFLAAFVSTGLLYVTLPGGVMFALMPGDVPTGLTMMAWFYPILVFGLVVKLQNPEDKIAPVLIAIGGFFAFLGGMIEIKLVFHFEGAGFFGAIHQILWFVMILASLGAIGFALEKFVPALAALRPFLALVTSVFVTWPLVSALLASLVVWHQRGGFVNFLLVLIHTLVGLIAYYAVLLLTAPEALDSLKSLLGQPIGVPATGGGGAAMASAPQMVPPHIHQQLIELDAAWSRGGMTPEEYHARRNAILAQAR